MIEAFEVLLSTTFRMLPPLLLAGLGGMISARVKITNMALEGMMLLGAFVAVVVTYFTGMAYLSLFVAAIVGGLLGFGFALTKIKLKADNIVVSIAINMFAAGITIYLMKIIFDVRGAISLPNMEGLPNLHIPFLEQIPILRSFSNQSILVYVSLLLVVVFQFLMYRTRFGLRIRATGPHAMAVVTAGVNADAYKYAALTISGILGALGGAHLSVGQLAMFSDNMTAGRGFIAMAATTFGGYTPIGTLLGALLFSTTDAATMRIQTAGFPTPLVQMIPYVLTLITLWLVVVHKKYVQQKRMSEGSTAL